MDAMILPTSAKQVFNTLKVCIHTLDIWAIYILISVLTKYNTEYCNTLL